jgi:peptide/nickel transport system permease protein
VSDGTLEPLTAPVAGSGATVVTSPSTTAAEQAPDRTSEVAERKPLGIVFWVCLAWVVLNILAAVLAGLLPIANPLYQNVNAINAGPSGAHLLGTDDLGRDILSRVIYGARVSLVIGFGSIAIGMVLGGGLGMWAGFRRGFVDTIVNSASYVLLAFPALVAIIAIVAFWGQAEWKITVVLGIASSPLLFRVVRASTLSYSTREFVTAARTLGATDGRILFREILPNILPAAVSFALIGVATVIVLEGSLAFLGLSVQPPIPSWGNMLNESRTYLGQNPWLALFPALAMFLFLLALNLVGDRIRQHFDVTEIQL